jgi:hypothetical protein
MTETLETGISDHAREDLRVLYQVTSQDLAFFKQQQWSTTNYALLLQASMVGVLQLTGATTTEWERIAACILATGVGAVGVALVATLERSITARRHRLSKVRAQLSPEFRDAWETPAKTPDSPITALVLGSAIVLGVVVVWWVVWLRTT